MKTTTLSSREVHTGRRSSVARNAPVMRKILPKARPIRRGTERHVGAKLPIEPISKRFPAEEEQPIVLTFFDPLAKNVAVAGTFNDWNSQATLMKNEGFGEWSAQLMLRAGQYEYRFVVDGRWTDDPLTSHRVPNPYGSSNSVLTVDLAVTEETFP
jgi:1,4-alpha-glucan branching enzyme